MKIFFGDPSHSWFTAETLLAWYSDLQLHDLFIHLPYHVYKIWDKQDFPSHFYCEVTEQHYVLTENQIDLAHDWHFIHVTWQHDLKSEVAYFFDEVKRLKDLYGNIRFIFAFDS